MKSAKSLSINFVHPDCQSIDIEEFRDEFLQKVDRKSVLSRNPSWVFSIPFRIA